MLIDIEVKNIENIVYRSTKLNIRWLGSCKLYIPATTLYFQ